MKCVRCPVAEGRECLGKTESFAYFCEWAATGDEQKVRHVAARSAIAEGKPLEPHPSIGYIDPVDYPSITAQAWNAAEALAKFVASGFKTVSKDEQAARLAICKMCEHFDAEQERCRQCGCYLAVKTYSKAEACPIDKW